MDVRLGGWLSRWNADWMCSKTACSGRSEGQYTMVRRERGEEDIIWSCERWQEFQWSPIFLELERKSPWPKRLPFCSQQERDQPSGRGRGGRTRFVQVWECSASTWIGLRRRRTEIGGETLWWRRGVCMARDLQSDIYTRVSYYD